LYPFTAKLVMPLKIAEIPSSRSFLFVSSSWESSTVIVSAAETPSGKIISGSSRK